MELDKSKVHTYPGNYDQYLALKEERLQHEALAMDRIETTLRREKEWMAKQPRARQAKSKAREAKYYELVALSKTQQDKDQKLTRTTGNMKLQLHQQSRRTGNIVAELHDVTYRLPINASHDKILIDSFSYDFQAKERIGIVGTNG